MIGRKLTSIPDLGVMKQWNKGRKHYAEWVFRGSKSSELLNLIEIVLNRLSSVVDILPVQALPACEGVCVRFFSEVSKV